MGVVTDDEARRPPRLSPCGRGRVAAVRRRRVRGEGRGRAPPLSGGGLLGPLALPPAVSFFRK
jgi:hypothetical protein